MEANIVKMILAEPEKYKDAINAIKKDITYMLIELKKNLRKMKLSFERNANVIQYGHQMLKIREYLIL